RRLDLFKRCGAGILRSCYCIEADHHQQRECNRSAHSLTSRSISLQVSPDKFHPATACFLSSSERGGCFLVNRSRNLSAPITRRVSLSAKKGMKAKTRTNATLPSSPLLLTVIA